MKGTLLFVLMALCATAAGQNLIMNGSFENHITCPQGYLSDVPPWQADPLGSVTVFDSCSPTIYTSVPVNGDSSLNYQHPHSGHAYAGMNIYWSDTLYRSYLIYPLDSHLQQNKVYCLCFFVNLANLSHYGIDAVGAYLSDTVPNCNSPICLYPANPQVSNPVGNILLDTLGWTEISGCFTASGEERYLIIGNFKPDSLVQKAYNRYNGYNWSTYYYIDDVSLYFDSTQSIAEASWGEQVQLYPNPASDVITIKLPEWSGAIVFELYNAIGTLCLNSSIDAANRSFEIGELPSGFYSYRLKGTNGKVANGKLVISKWE